MLKDPEFLDSMNLIIWDTVKESSVQDSEDGEVDDDIWNQCESSISPILLLELILAKVRGNTVKFSAEKHM